MMSSDSDDTKGISMTPMTSPAVITDEAELPRPSGCAMASRRSGPTVISAKRP